jgi:hypothetical protein
MLLLDQKAKVLFSKIDFAERKLKTISHPDEILAIYIEDLTHWLNALNDQIRAAQNEFREFVEETNFSESDYLRDEAQRGLLKSVLRTYKEIEDSFYLGVDTFLPLIPVWTNQRSTRDTKKGHKLLVDFIQELLRLSRIPNVMMTVLGEAHACLPLSWGNTTKHVVFVTYSEMENLRRWALLTHEIGHIFYDLHFEQFNSSVIPQVMRKLVETRPLNIGQRELETVIYIWTRKWIPELVSDCFSVKTLGPAFAVQFMLLALNSEPDRTDISHPPFNLRVDFMLDILESLALPDFNTDFYRNLWNSYSNSITRPSSRYILHEEVVETALRGIDTIVRDTPAKRKWTDIIAARQTLSDQKVPDSDLVSIVSAATLLEPTINLDFIYKVLLERHSSDPDAP